MIYKVKRLLPDSSRRFLITFYLDNKNFPQVPVVFYRFDGTNCLAALDGETLGLVSRASVVDLIEAVNAIVLG